MVITDVEAIPRVLLLDKPFEAGTYCVRNRNTIVVKITADEAIQGAVYGGDEDICQDEIVALINGEFKKMLVGKAVGSPEDIRTLYRDLMNYPIDLGYRALVDLDMGRHGIQQQALSLVDMALWDAFGKVQGKPVHQLLGGARRDSIPVIAIGGYYHDNEPQVSLTLLSVVEKIGPVEIFADERRDPLWKKILNNAPLLEDGKLKVPQGPGLGLELNGDVIDKLRI